MDPNQALGRLRIEIDRLAAFCEESGSPEFEVVDAFEALDQWLTRGGFLPDAWNHS